MALLGVCYKQESERIKLSRVRGQQAQAAEARPSPPPPPAARDLEAEWAAGAAADRDPNPGPRDLEAEWAADAAAEQPALEALEALDAGVSLGLGLGFKEPSAPASLGPAAVVNVFSDVPDDLFGAPFWLDGPAGDFGQPPPAAFPSVCSAPVPSSYHNPNPNPSPDHGGKAGSPLGPARGSCESIIEEHALPLGLNPNMRASSGGPFERAFAAGAGAAALPPLPPRSRTASDSSSSPRRSLDLGGASLAGSACLPPAHSLGSAGSNTHPAEAGGQAAAGELVPMQEEGLQALTLLDGEAPLAAPAAAPAPGQENSAELIRCATLKLCSIRP